MPKGKSSKTPAQKDAQAKRSNANKIRRIEKELLRNPSNVKSKERLEQLKKGKL